MKWVKYINYLVRHKWFVMVACFQMGLYLQGAIHDMSKFLPSEFMPYMEHFYGSKIGINRGRDGTGYYKPTDTGDKAFDFAWLLHQKRNKHHWQWWVIPEDEGGVKIFEMPIRYRKEMLADWKGAGKAQGKPDTKRWYEANGYKMSLGEETRQWIELNLSNKNPER